MLASSPVFAASFLITKALTRYERPEVIVVWQSITVTLFSLPLALLHWQMPRPGQWLLFLLCGILGSAGHYCLTRSLCRGGHFGHAVGEVPRPGVGDAARAGWSSATRRAAPR